MQVFKSHTSTAAGKITPGAIGLVIVEAFVCRFAIEWCVTICAGIRRVRVDRSDESLRVGIWGLRHRAVAIVGDHCTKAADGVRDRMQLLIRY